MSVDGSSTVLAAAGRPWCRSCLAEMMVAMPRPFEDIVRGLVGHVDGIGMMLFAEIVTCPFDDISMTVAGHGHGIGMMPVEIMVATTCPASRRS